MSNQLEIIRQGESLDFVFDRGGESIAGYVCTITVKQYPDDTAIIRRIIEPSTNSEIGGGEWSGFLTNNETAALVNGLWVINAKLVKADTDEEEAIPVRFGVAVTWATDFTFTVLDSDLNSFIVSRTVLNSDGDEFVVSGAVKNSDGDLFIVI